MQVAERGIDHPLPLDARLAGEGGAFDHQREMAFAGRIVAAVAAVLSRCRRSRSSTGRRKRRFSRRQHFGGDRSGGKWRPSPLYRGCFETRKRVASRNTRMARTGRGREGPLRGARLPRARRVPSTADAGQFRRARRLALAVPRACPRAQCQVQFLRRHEPGRDSRRSRRSPAGSARRALSRIAGADPAPAWSDFADPLDAISGRFRRPRARRRHRASLGPSSAPCPCSVLVRTPICKSVPEQLFEARPPLSSGSQRRRPFARRTAPRGHRSLSDLEESRRLRLSFVRPALAVGEPDTRDARSAAKRGSRSGKCVAESSAV